MPPKTSSSLLAEAPVGRRVYTVEQVCQSVQITPRTLRKLWSEGLGPRRVMIGGSIRILESDYDQWVESRPVDDVNDLDLQGKP